MKYSMQLLYIVFAIYLTFVVWSVDADKVSQNLNFVQMTYLLLIIYFSVMTYVLVLEVLVVVMELVDTVCS